MLSHAISDQGPSFQRVYGSTYQAAYPAGHRRLTVFAVVFVATCLIGLIYTFARTAQYRTMARLEITPAQVVRTGDTNTAARARPDNAPAFQAEVQVLTSRPLIAAALGELQRAGFAPPRSDDDPVSALQSMLEASAVPDTNVVHLQAVGADRELLPRLVNTLVDTYQRHLTASFSDNAAQALAQARDEAATLDKRVAQQRAEVQDFQRAHDIVSLERDENTALNRIKGMSTAMNDASRRVADAEGRLRSLQNAIAQGRSGVRARDNPTLAAIEQRASEIREQLSDMARTYTADYMALDPSVKSMRARLADLEAQVGREREHGQQAALAEAHEELDSAREAVNRMQSRLVADRQSAQGFAMRFSQLKAMQSELEQLEGLHAAAVERAATLEAGERGRRPQLRIIETAPLPADVWRPKYGRDAGISAGVALLLALFAVWLVEFIRPQAAEPGPPLFVTPSWSPQWMPAPQASAVLPLEPAVAEPALLPSARGLPRELSAAETMTLMDSVDGDARLALSGLLAGLSAEELVRLRWEAIDAQRGIARVGAAGAREVRLPEALRDALAPRRVAADAAAAATVLHDRQGAALATDDVEVMLLSAAHDAGLDDPASVTSAAVRHTYIAFLVRQGVRFTDLVARIGHLGSDMLAAYSTLAPEGRRLGPEQIDWVHPALDRPRAG